MKKTQTNFYNLIPYKDVLHLKVYSAWDESVAKEYFKDLQIIVIDLYKGANWSMIADCTEWGLNTPGAEAFFKNLSIDPDRPSSLTHLAILAGESELKKWQIRKQIQDDRNFMTEFFDDLQEAKTWLASFGYGMIPII